MASSTNLGFPRIGKNRELKKAVEAFWKKKISETQLLQELETIHETNLKTQIAAGLDYIPLGDFCAYDLMLDTALALGVVPKRFAGLKGMELYFAMARGTQKLTACEMKKWFNTNYHYIVPEIEGSFTLQSDGWIKMIQSAKKKFSAAKFRFVLIGPFTFLKLSRIKNGKTFKENLTALAKVYQDLVAQLAQTGCPWLQLDEPALCGDVTKEELQTFSQATEQLAAKKGKLKIMLQTYFGDVADFYPALTKLPVDGIGLDLIYGPKNKEALQKHGVPASKTLGLGILDGRNVWKTNFNTTLAALEQTVSGLKTAEVFINPTCSLHFLPVSLEGENKIPNVLKSRLCFANERLQEVVVLTEGANRGASAISKALQENEKQLNNKEFSDFAFDAGVQKKVKGLSEKDFARKTPFAKRIQLQQKQLNLPKLPTTTIGSFPQTVEIREKRLQWKKGELSTKAYQQFVREEMERVVRLQEEVGLDVLVHGEPERSDMVEYFAEQLKGFQFTQNGWVQSYGSRCVRAPIIYGDVVRKQAMTVEESKFAQSLTDKPMKGMLTGPVTIVNWSFPRNDVSKQTTAFQIGLALRDETIDLEKAGLSVIQIDEPALREGLPLRKKDWKQYLNWAVDAFRLSAGGVKDTTQIHTHMCYSEFSDILDSIQALDADVLSIEDTRSNGTLAKNLAEMNYKQALGPGVYDIHSEQIPSKEDFKKRIQFLVDNIPLNLLWINPDCGLKTRGYKEVTPSLKNLVDAVKEVRATL